MQFESPPAWHGVSLHTTGPPPVDEDDEVELVVELAELDASVLLEVAPDEDDIPPTPPVPLELELELASVVDATEVVVAVVSPLLEDAVVVEPEVIVVDVVVVAVVEPWVDEVPVVDDVTPPVPVPDELVTL